jgi:hypothetical protein
MTSPPGARCGDPPSPSRAETSLLDLAVRFAIWGRVRSGYDPTVRTRPVSAHDPWKEVSMKNKKKSLPVRRLESVKASSPVDSCVKPPA